MKTKEKILSIAALCQELFESNFRVYEYENKKWSMRKNNTANLKNIDEWDKSSREWNERRAKIKKKIDLFIHNAVISGNISRDKISINKPEKEISLKVLPISLMIDMLIIENIKLVDSMKKGSDNGLKESRLKIAALKKLIDSSFDYVVVRGKYDILSEMRTF